VFCLIPNTPVEVRQGIVVYGVPDERVFPVDTAVEAQVLELFRAPGSRRGTIPERLLGAAAAISSVGPAYQALLAEARSMQRYVRVLAPSSRLS